MDTQLDWNVVAHRSLSRKQGAPCSATGWWGCDSQPVRSASCATRTASPSVLRTSPSDYYSTRRKHHSILRPHASLLENPAICCVNLHILFVPSQNLEKPSWRMDSEQGQNTLPPPFYLRYQPCEISLRVSSPFSRRICQSAIIPAPNNTPPGLIFQLPK